jgi:hypothetical protein
MVVLCRGQTQVRGAVDPKGGLAQLVAVPFLLAWPTPVTTPPMHPAPRFRRARLRRSRPRREGRP